MSLPELESRLTALTTEIKEADTHLRALSAAEKPAEGLQYAADIHRLRQEKLQKRLEMDYCSAKMRFLQTISGGSATNVACL